MAKESKNSKKVPSDEHQNAKNKMGDTFDMSGDFRGATINIKSTVADDSENNVRRQNLREFTVQILKVDDDANVGTGIAISTDGKVVTCAHVVQAAGVDPRNSNGAEVGVYFPQARGGEEKKRRATVLKYFEDRDDDVVLLQLTGGASPLAPEQIAVIGNTRELSGIKFESFGYRSFQGGFLGKQLVGVPARGTVIGAVELMEENKFHKNPLLLESNQFNTEMSGAGVLDLKDNLIVGIVSHMNVSDGTGGDQNTAFGVDARVLPLPPFDLSLRTEPLPLRPAPEPKTDEETKKQVFKVAEETVTQRSIQEKYSWNNAPAVLTEWTGRDHLLEQITGDWNDPKKHVTGLIGFGGEGKSSLARKWVETIIESKVEGQKSQPADLEPSTFDGVFWWGFYENRSVDEFLEAALKYMSGGRIDPRAVPSSNLKAQIIGAMLGTGKYLFILDGLEVMQHQEGDQYGLLESNDLRDLLTFFGRSDNRSFCLVTSRAPLLDLMDYTTYTHRDVERLSEEDGRALLIKLGVKGSDDELNQVVADWDGHVLTLSILAAYLVERFNGDIHHLDDIPVPTADEPRYERVHRVLRRYDEHLSQEEREFLKLFSVFRLPVKEDAFEKVFEPLLQNVGATHESPRCKAEWEELPLLEIVSRLVTYRLIRHDKHENSYTTHPLIRNHYFAIFTKGDPSQEKAIHEQIKDYYLSIAGFNPKFPTLDDLKPLIEAVHHACQSGAYDEAYNIRKMWIDQGSKFILMKQLGAYDIALNLMYEFFPNRDTDKEPQCNTARSNRHILNDIGLCFKNLGRIRETVPFFERTIGGSIGAQDWINASVGYQNLANLHAQLGMLDASTEAARQALDFARKADDEFQIQIVQSLSYQGWIFYLQGNLESAQNIFIEAEQIEKSDYRTSYLYSIRGVYHAAHLRRTGDLDYARRVTEPNLKICEQNHWVSAIIRCHCILGDLDSDTGNQISAREHYESALKIARGISSRDVLIEALLARGRFFAKFHKDLTGFSRANLSGLEQAFNDLNEALSYCVESGYRIYEADVRVALAWAYLASGEKEKAKASAERALQMSNEMGYHWGKLDAEEVLKAISG